ncbi:unnamed protein product [Meloidogyne enterolobii]|uniref:Uncharacterized protein n=1 Tax=Meloidogyne enterolobii TaxID=390850 RepID=A0ACB1A3T0_MELEN
MVLGDQRKRKLEKAYKGCLENNPKIIFKSLLFKAYQLLREANDLAEWIKSRETVASQQEIGQDLEHAEVLQTKFNDFKCDLKENEVRLQEMNQIATSWKALEQKAEQRGQQLESAHEVQRFHKDVEETRDWIQEKNEALDTEDFGRDLRSVQALQRKHEGVERDLAALGDKIRALDEKANRLRFSRSREPDWG